MTFLLPSVQLRQAIACLECSSETGATLTAEDVQRLLECFGSVARAVEKLEQLASDVMQDNLDEAFLAFVRPPVPAPGAVQP